MSKIPVEKSATESKSSIPEMETAESRFDRIRRHAFAIFQSRSPESASAVDDWLQAEREILNLPEPVVYDSGDAYELRFAAPGFRLEDLKVSALPKTIMLRALSNTEAQPESAEGEVHTETSSLFQRCDLPTPIQLDEVSARLDKNGSVVVHAMKKTAALAAAK